MICGKLVAEGLFLSVPQTLSVHLDSTSYERLRKAHSTACALAPWLSGNTLTIGADGRNPAMVSRVQNAYRVHLGDGIRGSLFIVNEANGPSSWRFQQHRQNHLRISGPRMELSVEWEFKSIEQTVKSMARFASVSQSPGPTLFFCLPVQTLNRCLHACGRRGSVHMMPPSPQRSLWSIRERLDY